MDESISTYTNVSTPKITLEDLKRMWERLEALKKEQIASELKMSKQLADLYGPDALLPPEQWPPGCIAVNMKSVNGLRLALAIQDHIEFAEHRPPLIGFDPIVGIVEPFRRDLALLGLMLPGPIPFPREPPRPGV